MVSIKSLVLGAAVLAGAAGLAAKPAQAAEFVVGVRAPVAYVPACPGPGYVWVAGFWNGGYWVPGRWNFVGVRGPVYGYGHYDRFRGYDHGRFYDHRFDHFRR